MPVASCDICGSKDAPLEVGKEFRKHDIEIVCLKCNHKIQENFLEIKARKEEEIDEEKHLWLEDWLANRWAEGGIEV